MSIELDILEGAPKGPWMLETPAPTTLVLVGADEELTGIAQGLAAEIADVVGEAIDVDRPEATPQDVAWIAALHVPGLPAPLLCWPESEAIEGTGLPEELEHRQGLVVQTLLYPGDPLTCFINLARLLAMIDPKAPGLLDADTGRWLDRATLEQFFLGDAVEPQEDVLWVVEAALADSGRVLRSRGLERCGRCELQIGPVQDQRVDAAADLIATLAALSLETPLPEPGVTAEVGPGMHLQLAQVDTCASVVNAQGAPPEDILQRLSEGVGAMYRTDRSARRSRALAQQTWVDFIDIASLDAHECLVEVPFEDPTGRATQREHVWMRVREVQEAAVLAEPVHEPIFAVGIDTEPQRIESTEIASWRVVIDDQVWGPDHLAALQERLRS
ncbi:MAG: hypothetical protein MK101_00955 [Phycisphaerales bacterium]|nr:hypothetical protein [Phycisphaerales bacterium]